jgi:hypothetical protein
MNIIALLSVYDEDKQMFEDCIKSVSMFDYVLVFDGPTTSDENFTSTARLSDNEDYYEVHGYWKSDADKRTEMLILAKVWDREAWGLWLDGDEILLYGEYLKTLCKRAEIETATGGVSLRIVEYDGSVSQSYGKLIKLSEIRRYVMSSYEVILRNGITVALPNVPICSAGGLPIGEITNRDDPILALARPPVIGEPHILHRHGFRNPEREAPRLHDKESEDIQRLVEEGR